MILYALAADAAGGRPIGCRGVGTFASPGSGRLQQFSNVPEGTQGPCSRRSYGAGCVACGRVVTDGRLTHLLVGPGTAVCAGERQTSVPGTPPHPHHVSTTLRDLDKRTRTRTVGNHHVTSADHPLGTPGDSFCWSTRPTVEDLRKLSGQPSTSAHGRRQGLLRRNEGTKCSWPDSRRSDQRLRVAC
jgi:hypothetical protein